MVGVSGVSVGRRKSSSSGRPCLRPSMAARGLENVRSRVRATGSPAMTSVDLFLAKVAGQTGGCEAGVGKEVGYSRGRSIMTPADLTRGWRAGCSSGSKAVEELHGVQVTGQSICRPLRWKTANAKRASPASVRGEADDLRSLLPSRSCKSSSIGLLRVCRTRPRCPALDAPALRSLGRLIGTVRHISAQRPNRRPPVTLGGAWPPLPSPCLGGLFTSLSSHVALDKDGSSSSPVGSVQWSSPCKIRRRTVHARPDGRCAGPLPRLTPAAHFRPKSLQHQPCGANTSRSGSSNKRGRSASLSLQFPLPGPSLGHPNIALVTTSRMLPATQG